MFAHLRGELARVEPDYVVIDVNGVGYKVHPPLAVITTLPKIGQPVELLISTVVREDSITLYGFAAQPEQSLFELLLTVSGVGPKVALNILSVSSVEQLVNSISNENFHDLSRVPGIGTKTAQRIVLELREKITSFVWARAAKEEVPEEQRVIDDAIEGLVALGYNRNDARRAAEKACKGADDKSDTGQVITAALKSLSKG